VTLRFCEAPRDTAQLTGGGFGGSVGMLARRGSAREAAQRIAARYEAQTGHAPTILVLEI
jgi:galactokinase